MSTSGNITGSRSTAPTPNAVAARTDGSASVRGVELAWTSEGEGPLTLWAHGMTNDRWALEDAGLYDWSPVVASGRRLLRYDARGHGASQGRPAPEDYEWSSYAQDLLALLDVLSPDAPVAVMGASMGTASIITAALRAPERFTAVVLAATPTAWETRQAQVALYEQGAAIAEHDGGAAFEKITSSQPKQGLFRDLPDYPPRLAVADELLPSVLRGGARSNLPPAPSLRGLDVPCLVLSYTDDPTHPVSSGERVADLVPGAELHVAGSVEGLRTWGDRAAAFLAASA